MSPNTQNPSFSPFPATPAPLHPQYWVKFQQCTRLGFVLLLASCAWGQSSPPVIAAGGIVNAADFSSALAPGAMVSIFGTNLAPRTASASAIPLPTTLEGVSVEAVSGFSFSQLPLYFVSAGQINAQLPYSIMGTSLEIRVRTAAGLSASRQIAITPRAPRLFTKTMDGKGEAILLHAANYRLVTDLEPATPGESAEKVAEDVYAFKPTSEVRSFAQMLGHVADAQYMFCAAVLGEQAPRPGVEKSKSTKEELIPALKEAFAYCDKAYEGMTDAEAVQTLKFFNREMAKATVLGFNAFHTMEHYGNLVTYMRLKGIVPPSSERR